VPGHWTQATTLSLDYFVWIKMYILVTAGTATWEVTGNILPRSLRGRC